MIIMLICPLCRPIMLNSSLVSPLYHRDCRMRTLSIEPSFYLIDVRVDKERKAIALLLFTTALQSSSSALTWFLQIPANTFHPGNRSPQKSKKLPL